MLRPDIWVYLFHFKVIFCLYLFLLVLQHNIIIGHFYDRTDSYGYFYGNNWWVPAFPLPSHGILLIQGCFKKSDENGTGVLFSKQPLSRSFQQQHSFISNLPSIPQWLLHVNHVLKQHYADGSQHSSTCFAALRRMRRHYSPVCNYCIADSSEYTKYTSLALPLHITLSLK